MFAVDNDVLVLSISASRYIHYLSFLIDDESSICFEDLPPVRVDARSHSEI
jgi:hypothetical protein